MQSLSYATTQLTHQLVTTLWSLWLPWPEYKQVIPYTATCGTQSSRKGSRFPVAKYLLEKTKLYMNCVYLVATSDSALHAWLLYLGLLPRRPLKAEIACLAIISHYHARACTVTTSVPNCHVAKLFYHSTLVCCLPTISKMYLQLLLLHNYIIDNNYQNLGIQRSQTKR